jgi:hypothetical protein
MKIKTLLKRFPLLFSLAISAGISMIVFILVVIGTFEVIIQIYPSHEVMPNGKIVRYEAFAQLFGSVIISGLVSIFVFIIGFKKLNNKFSVLN